MASRAYQGGGQPLPIALIGQAVPMLTRHELEALAERLLDALDSMDAPTVDLEPDEDCCGAHEDRGSSYINGGVVWAHGAELRSEDDEHPWQPLTLN